MKTCDYSGEDKPLMPGKGKGGLSAKPDMKKGGKKGGGKLGHDIHHKHMPHGLKGPSKPAGY